MENYIVISHIDDQQDADFFEKEVKSTFPKYQEEENSQIKYLGFAAKKRAEVEDKLKDILHRIGISNEDYVALYYTKEENEDQIMRAMLLGHDIGIERDLEEVNQDDHVDALSRLLNHDFTKANG